MQYYLNIKHNHIGFRWHWNPKYIYIFECVYSGCLSCDKASEVLFNVCQGLFGGTVWQSRTLHIINQDMFCMESD